MAKKIIVFWTNPAEGALLEPVIKRLEADPDIECIPCHLNQVEWQLEDLYQDAHDFIEDHSPDMVVTSFDRIQMLICATAAKSMNVPICQYHAGDISEEGNWDDDVRHAITMLADLVLCNGAKSYHRARYMKQYASDGKFKDVYEVGSTALDDVEFDYSTVPRQPNEEIDWEVTLTGDLSSPIKLLNQSYPIRPFDLVLYNPPTKHPEVIDDELMQIWNLVYETTLEPCVVWIRPNGDPGSDKINRFIDRKKELYPNDVIVHDRLPRPQYFAHMDKSRRIVGNSSSFFKEAPFFKAVKEIHHVGLRNTGRLMMVPYQGGSQAIVDRIKEYWKID